MFYDRHVQRPMEGSDMTGRARILAAASGIALGLGVGGAASAQGFFGTGAHGTWYGKVFGGATFPQSEDPVLRGGGAGGQSFDLDYNTGFTLGGAVGFDYTPNFAMELEYAYRQADLDDPVAGHTSSNAVMLNALYKFNAMGPNGAVVPYFGGGLGWANIDAATDQFGSFKRDNTFAYQVIGGVEYEMGPAWSLLGELRWFGTDEGAAEGPGGQHFETQLETVDLLVGASFNF
jgi:opacity protein-like surface antigen